MSPRKTANWSVSSPCGTTGTFITYSWPSLSRGKGLARALWQAARAASLEACNPGVFTVNSSRFAVGLYEKLGFVGHGEVVDESGVIHIPMKLELG
ncbi:GNAT family N-acetyltransferase [Methylocaldum sp. MU1018]